MVETLDTKLLDVRIQFFQYATIPITELKFELTPRISVFQHTIPEKVIVIWNKRKKEMDRAVDPTLYTHTHY